jgi:hypothetical protein
MPPAVVAEELVATVQLPGPGHIEGVVVQQGDPAGAVIAVGAAQGEKEDPAGPAVDGVRPRVAGLGGQLLGLDLADDAGIAGVGLGIQHIDPRGADPWDDQVEALQRCAVAAMTLVAQGAGTGAPAEVVQLVACGGQLAPADAW